MLTHKNGTTRYSWLGGAGLVLSLLACYGTLGLVLLLSLMGVSLAVNVQIWAGTIVAFAFIAVAGLALGFRRHRKFGPLVTAIAGALLVVWAMYGSDSIRVLLDVPGRAVELAGFAVLVTATAWDWRLKTAQAKVMAR